MSPTTKKMKDKAKPKTKREAKVAPWPTKEDGGPKELTVDGVTLANRHPYFLASDATKVELAEATIKLLAETAALKGEDYEPLNAATTWAKKHTPEQLREQHTAALDALVKEHLRIKAADEAEAKAAAAEAPVPGPKATRQRTPRAADTRMPAVGTVLTKTGKDGTKLEATVVEGGVLFDGTTYKSLSAAAVAGAAKLGLCSKAQNGFAFWGLLAKGPRTPRASSAGKLVEKLREQLAKAQARVAQLKVDLEEAEKQTLDEAKPGEVVIITPDDGLVALAKGVVASDAAREVADESADYLKGREAAKKEMAEDRWTINNARSYLATVEQVEDAFGRGFDDEVRAFEKSETERLAKESADALAEMTEEPKGGDA